MDTLPNVLKGSLKHLEKQCQKKQGLELMIEKILPSYIMDHCKIGNVDEATGEITLMLDNACWLLKCRHLTNDILASLNTSNNRWQTIHWRIRPQDKLHVKMHDERY